MVRIETNLRSGSGAIYETEGRTAYIITNHHVIEGYNRVRVTVNDRDRYRGEVLGADSVRDLVVVEICCGDFTPIPFGDASSLEPGDEVVNIGYPLGLSGEATITRGIVSAIRYDPRHRSDVIQTDAATNPGNSGGPMLSLSGKILGINTFGIDESASGRPVEGLNFAISEETVQERIPVLRADTASSTPTPTRRLSPTPRPNPDGTNSFGPISGELQHDPSDSFIETEYANVSMADMIVEATFTNPYSSSYNSWDYGFIFRKNRNTPFIHVVVNGDGRWSLKSGDGAPYNNVSGGTLSNLNANDGGKNHLRIIAIGKRGWFFVNDELVSDLDLSEVTRAGDVAVITGAFEGDEVDGKATRFEDFTGTRLNRRYGPANGKLEKEPGFVAKHSSGVRTRDMVAEAEFITPQGEDWDYGFIIRNPEFNRLEVIGIHSTGYWFHKTRNVDDDKYTDVAESFLSSAGPFSHGRNLLLLIAIGDTGWLFLNDDLVSKLDLSHNLDSGWVSVMGDFFRDHQASPEFENFNVCAP